MGRRNKDRSEQMRRLIAQESARIMLEQGVRDYRLAKQKAAARFGVSDRAVLPRNTDIEAALGEHQRLFSGDAHARRLRLMRETARSAMALFEPYSPRLVGPVLSGTASHHASVGLHVFADTFEQVRLHLVERDIPHELGEHRVRLPRGGHAIYPQVRFVAGDVRIEATVFPTSGLREAPLSGVDGRPERRASPRELDELLAAADVHQPAG